jgi:hypothetical protein
MDYVAYRELVGVIFTEEEAKAEAAEVSILLSMLLSLLSVFS